jgi:pimeloyl-ACP methyl ester carboxylesterase
MNDILSGLLKNVAPGLATAVMGPMGGAAVSALAAKFGVSDSIESVAKAIAGDPAAAQKLQEVELEFYKIEQNNLTDRLKADMSSDSWLSKNIRPMVLVFLLVAYSGFAICSMFDLETRGAYVELLGQWGMLVMSFYFGGRTMEKIADKVGKK